MRLKDFFDAGDSINDAHGSVYEEVTRLEIRIKELHDSLKGSAAAQFLYGALCTCSRPPALFCEGLPRCFFVRKSLTVISSSYATL